MNLYEKAEAQPALTVLEILSSAAVLYYIGKAGFEWGKNVYAEDQKDSKCIGRIFHPIHKTNKCSPLMRALKKSINK